MCQYIDNYWYTVNYNSYTLISPFALIILSSFPHSVYHPRETLTTQYYYDCFHLINSLSRN